MEVYTIKHNNNTPIQLKPVVRNNNNNTPIPLLSPLQSSVETPLKSLQAQEAVNVSVFPKRFFIESNTTEVELGHLSNDCIIPVFSKDNEKTIAHQEFIEAVQEAAYKAFPNAQFQTPEIRVSHQIKGRIPTAIHKPVKELLDQEKTIYYERIAFIMKSDITQVIGGNELQLTVGGVRALNTENLYNKKSTEKFKFFIGFQNQVCLNLCISTDGFQESLKVMHVRDLEAKALEIMQSYRAESHLKAMQEFTNYSLSEHQFATLVGRARLYHHLPKKLRTEIPALDFNDGQFSTIAKDYYHDESFCRDDTGNIDLWKVYNLFTQANKSSYIDTFLERNVNAFDFNQGIVKALSGSSSDYAWFLS